MMSLINALPGAVAQGLIWGIMAIGVYLTFRILDIADLTVDGSLGTGGANPDPAWSVFHQFKDHGEGKPGNQCRQV